MSKTTTDLKRMLSDTPDDAPLKIRVGNMVYDLKDFGPGSDKEWFLYADPDGVRKPIKY
jgi:hypothetical protein